MRPSLLALVLALPTLTLPAAAQADLRAWHADGQTFLVWRDDQTFSAAESWSVYRSDAPIVDLAQAQLVARTYPEDARGARLHNADPTANWVLPDASGTGTYALLDDEALFVYTPRVATQEHFAVVKTGDTALSAENTAGPVPQALDPVVPHVQLTGVDAGHAYTLYAVWIDGDADETAGRPGFPVLGAASLRGMARLFCVFEPTGGLPAAPMPAVVFLHGGGGNYWNYRPSKSADHRFSTHVEDGLLVTFDGRIYVRTPSVFPDGTMDINDRWLGTCRGFDRFERIDQVPPDDEVVVDYTVRWLAWAQDWLVAARGVDPDRLAMMGLSGGGRGTCQFLRIHPERVSAATTFVMSVTSNLVPLYAATLGTEAQNLATTVGGGIGVMELCTATTRVSDLDLPFLRMVDGTNDAQVPWSTKPPVYAAVDADRWGAAIYWDERGHTVGWQGSHFVGSPRHDAQWLTRYRRDRSFPAFHGVDHALGQPGTQPDPGDAQVPANGDAWGSWGGWFDWDPTTIVDEPTRWRATLGLVTGASFGPDNAPASLARASVTIRRPQAFQPEPGSVLLWTLRRASDGVLVSSGTASVDPQGLVTVPDLPFGPAPLRLEVLARVERGGLNPL